MTSLAPPKVDKLLKTAGLNRYGVVVATDGLSLKIEGLAGHAALGDTVSIATESGRDVRAKVVAMDGEIITGFAYGSLTGAAVGNVASLDRISGEAFPCEDWIGRIIDPFGLPLDDGPLRQGSVAMPLEHAAPNAAKRKMLGSRMSTGLSVLDTLLPICRGQRVGLFAGSGVGKSTLLGDIARGVECDVAVVAMIGERGREVRSFIEETLGPEGMKKTIVIASTADESPLAKNVVLTWRWRQRNIAAIRINKCSFCLTRSHDLRSRIGKLHFLRGKHRLYMHSHHRHSVRLHPWSNGKGRARRGKEI